MTRPKNDTLIRALLRQPTAYTPVWIMRQAGRYLPEYNATRARAGSFLALAKNPDLATEVTMQPLARFDLDAAIVFSDILTIPDAMGLGLYFVDGEGPKFERAVRDENDVSKLFVPDADKHLRYVMDAVAQIRRALNDRIPLIGFAGSPYTLACYMIEGGASADFRHIKAMMYSRPDVLHRVLRTNARAVTAALNAQIEAGAQVAMVFDTWGGSLSAQAYREFSLPYMEEVVAGLIDAREGQRIPKIVFTKGGGAWLEDMARTTADALGIDWMTDIGTARSRTQSRVALQGNLDPGTLFGSPQRIRDEVAAVLAAYGEGSGHVFNLGHGISQYTDPSRVAVLVDAVHELSPAYHRITHQPDRAGG